MTTATGLQPAQALGAVIGPSGGLAFVLVNSAPLPTALAVVLRVAAVVAFVVVLATVLRGRGSSSDGAASAGVRFTRGYWLVVLAEVAAFAAGVAVLDALGRGELGVAWVALVVGAHFVGLAALWSEPSLAVLGGVLAVLGAVALTAGFAGASEAVTSGLGGVLPGAVLLAGGLHAVLRH